MKIKSRKIEDCEVKNKKRDCDAVWVIRTKKCRVLSEERTNFACAGTIKGR